MNNKASYCAKVGMILLKLTDPDLIRSLDDLWDTRESQDGYYDKIFLLNNELENVLTKCQDVKNMSKDKKEDDSCRKNESSFSLL